MITTTEYLEQMIGFAHTLWPWQLIFGPRIIEDGFNYYPSKFFVNGVEIDKTNSVQTNP